MKHFTVTAFADEINGQVTEQIRVLKENGISHIEIRGLDGKNISELTLEEARHYKKQLDQAGICVSSLGSPIGKIGIHDAFSEHLATFKHVLELALIFESPYVRMFSFFINATENYDAYEAAVIDRWQQFLAVAQDYPTITLLHENEKEIYGDTPERCLHLLETLNSPQVKAAFDPANFVQCNVEVYPHAFDLLKDHIAYVHIKDAKFSDHQVTPAGLGDGKVATVLQKLAENSFEGFTSLEPHLTFFEGFTALEKQLSVALTATNENERLFNVASQALKTILVDELGEEWQ